MICRIIKGTLVRLCHKDILEREVITTLKAGVINIIKPFILQVLKEKLVTVLGIEG
jgi:hypothetical protein